MTLRSNALLAWPPAYSSLSAATTFCPVAAPPHRLHRTRGRGSCGLTAEGRARATSSDELSSFMVLMGGRPRGHRVAPPVPDSFSYVPFFTQCYRWQTQYLAHPGVGAFTTVVLFVSRSAAASGTIPTTWTTERERRGAHRTPLTMSGGVSWPYPPARPVPFLPHSSVKGHAGRERFPNDR